MQKFNYHTHTYRCGHSDGSISDDTISDNKTTSDYAITYSSVSLDLVQDLRDVLFSLGVVSSIMPYMHTANGRKFTVYILRVKIPS